MRRRFPGGRMMPKHLTLLDWWTFKAYWWGPAMAVWGCVAALDFNRDHRIDLRDYAEFQNRYECTTSGSFCGVFADNGYYVNADDLAGNIEAALKEQRRLSAEWDAKAQEVFERSVAIHD